jgi:Ca2+/Na+ antiporter
VRSAEAAPLVPPPAASSRRITVIAPVGDWKHAAKTLLLGSKLNLLLVCIPLAVICAAAGAGNGIIFFFALASIWCARPPGSAAAKRPPCWRCSGARQRASGSDARSHIAPRSPLAERLGFITEQLAMYTNPTVGGLLNASFGNATEVIVSVAGLRAGLLRVVQLSLLGSVLSNMLLVLGCAFLAGGTRYKEQTFNVTGVGVNITLLMLAVVAQCLPALLTASHTALKGTGSDLALSRFTSFIMLAMCARGCC